MAHELILRRRSSRFIPDDERDNFWEAVHAGTVVGAIVAAAGNADPSAQWHWSVHLHAGPPGNGLSGLSGGSPTREQAMADYRVAFDRAKAHIGAEGWALHLQHMDWLHEQAARWARQKAGTEPGGYG